MDQALNPVAGQPAPSGDAAAAATADCFITVPDVTLPGGIVVPSFRVGQFVCSKGENGRLAVTAAGVPWVNISYHEARAACAAAGYAQITERQWLAIAIDAARQDCNWTGGQVGAGKLFRGLRKGSVSGPQPGDYTPADEKERRWLTLSNGERICDLNGNVRQWVFDDLQGDENGLTTVIETDSPSLVAAPYPSMKKGMGWRPDGRRDWSGNALVRAAYWRSGRDAGPFYLGRVWPDYRYGNVGFRCTQPIRVSDPRSLVAAQP